MSEPPVSEPRICIVAANFSPDIGGMESQALSHVRALRQRGYTVTILTLRHRHAWPIHEEIEGAPVVRVAGPLLRPRARLPHIARKPLYVLSVMLLAGMLWRYRRQYDIVQVYQLTILATLCALVCLLAKKRLVVGVRGIGGGSVVADAGKSARSARVRSPSFGGELAHLRRFGRLTVWVTRILLRRVDAVVLVLSTRSIAYLAAYGFGDLPVLLLPNGVDTDHFAPAATSSLAADGAHADGAHIERADVVICVARFVPVKGVDVLLRAWQLVGERAPRARLLLVGDGPLRPQLERLALDLGAHMRVAFVGEQDDALPWLRRAAIAVLPSHGEGLSNALLEAMACGLPCVATRVSGSEDVIQSGVNGMLIEPGDAPALADALLTLLRDPALARRYGQAARRTIERHYARERITDQYVDLYRQMMSAHRWPTRRAQLSMGR